MRALVLIAAVLLLGGCAYQIAGMQPGASTDEVSKRAGKPTDTWREGGTEVWEYATGPYGRQTYLARFDGGRLTGVQQVLSEEYFKRVNAGASRDDIRHLLGRPGSTEYYKNLDEELWSWRFFADKTPMFFNVHFDRTSGRVKYTSYSVDPSQTLPFGAGGGSGAI